MHNFINIYYYYFIEQVRFMDKLLAAIKELISGYNMSRIKAYIKSLQAMHVVVGSIVYFICLEILPKVTIGLTFLALIMLAVLFLIKEIL